MRTALIIFYKQQNKKHKTADFAFFFYI